MKVKIFEEKETNSGLLVETDEKIDIRKHRWIDKQDISHPMNFKSPNAFDNNNVYYLLLYGDNKAPYYGKHISLSFCENQKFLWIQKSHWFQKEENIRYIVNVLFLISGVVIGILNLIKL